MPITRSPTYAVYVMTNRSDTLYIGVSNNLERRVWEHQQGASPGFATQYRTTRLIYAENFTEVRDAIAREKQLKKWSRAKKLALTRSLDFARDDTGRVDNQEHTT